MVGRFSPNSSCGACRHALGKPLGSFQILRHVASSLESIVVMVYIESKECNDALCVHDFGVGSV